MTQVKDWIACNQDDVLAIVQNINFKTAVKWNSPKKDNIFLK